MVVVLFVSLMQTNMTTGKCFIYTYPVERLARSYSKHTIKDIMTTSQLCVSFLS